MDINKVIKISKFLSYVLRHHPDEIDLTLDDAGWVAVDALLNNASKHGKTITFDELKTIVKKNEKKRFEFNDDQTKIRASQGHSIQVDLGYTHQKPPDVLYHGTATRFLESIREKGLIKGGRHHVHLSTDKKTMLDVGRRYGKPILLEINAAQMFTDGHKFFLSTNNVWLVDYVPPKYIKIPDHNNY